MIFDYLFNKENRVASILSCIYFVFGLLFCILPNFMMETFETIFCILMLIYGSIIMFAYCITSAVANNKKLIISAVISIIVAVLLLFVRAFFVLALAICLFSFAIFKLIVLIKLRSQKNANWYIWLIVSILYLIVFVIVLIFFILNKFLNFSMILIGICLICESLSSILILLNNKKIIDSQKSTVEE